MVGWLMCSKLAIYILCILSQLSIKISLLPSFFELSLIVPRSFFRKISYRRFAASFYIRMYQWQIHMSCEVRDCFEKVCDELLDSIYHEGSILLCQKHWEEISQDPEKLEQLGLKSRVW